MATVKEVRALIDQTLDRWEAAASALEANAESSSAAVAERVEALKGKAAKASESLKQAVAQAQQLPSEARESIATGLDHLKVQLALGKAEAHDAMVNQKKQISAATQRVEEEIDKINTQIDTGTDQAVAHWVKADQVLKQEFELAELRFQGQFEKTQQQIEANKQAFLDQAKEFRGMVETHATKAQEKGSEFADEMRTSFEQAVTAFRNLSK
ncbi:MAG: hypothetical protein ACR2PG_11350 [Hyphomicrobiaceae bacterium]